MSQVGSRAEALSDWFAMEFEYVNVVCVQTLFPWVQSSLPPWVSPFLPACMAFNPNLSRAEQLPVCGLDR